MGRLGLATSNGGGQRQVGAASDAGSKQSNERKKETGPLGEGVSGVPLAIDGTTEVRRPL